MKVLDMTFVQGFIRMADDGFRMGWHERNGGNLSYRIKPEEIAMIRNRLKDDGPWLPIGTSVPDLAGEYFLVTGSGKFFRDIKDDPEATLAIIKLPDQMGTCRGWSSDQRAAEPPDESCGKKTCD